MSEYSKRDWSWTPVITIAGMHVMMTAITVTVMLFSYGDLNNRMLSVEEKLEKLDRGCIRHEDRNRCS